MNYQTVLNSIEDERRQAADKLFDTYEFNRTIVASNGWQTDTDEWTRVFFYEDEDKPEGDSIKGTFVIRWKHGYCASVEEAYISGE